MTSYPQNPNLEIVRDQQEAGQRGPGDNPLADPGIRMVLSMSPQDGAIKPLPENLTFAQQPNGSVRFTFPDGSLRELIPGASGEGRMITTLADGTRIQSDLTFGEGQVSVSSISSTGEKTLLSLNENGANMQRVTADGEVSNFIPDSAPELIQSYREAEAFAQAEELRAQAEYQSNQEFGDWNNYGKPGDWQPEVNWQPEQNWQPPQNFGGDYQGVNFNRPDYAGENWVNVGNGAWVAPLQPDAFTSLQPQEFSTWNNFGKPADWQPEQNWQPPQNFAAPQNFEGGFNQPNFAPPATFMPQQNPYGHGISIGSRPEIQEAPRYAPATDFGPANNFGKPADWQPEQNWQPPQNFAPPAAFMPPQNFTAPQHFDGGFNQPNFAPPAAFMPPQNFTAPQHFDGGFNQSNFAPPAAFMPPQNFGPTAAFNPPPVKDPSGFPVAANDYQAGANQPNQSESSAPFDGTTQAPSFEAVGQNEGTDSQQQPPQY